MPIKGFDVAAATTLITYQVNFVTCLECCKFYIAPERATCGHTLCHCCWKGRRACPTCATPLERRALKLDAPLKALTEHVQEVTEVFGQLFGLTMDEFVLDGNRGQDAGNDPSKHVKAWLTSSDNHFSAPPFSDTQRSTQDILPPVELSRSKVQIHVEVNRSQSPEKIVHIPPPQDDWDKIDAVPDTEEICVKNKENVIGPMDFEPFCLDDEYTDKNPRRSSRKRENRIDSAKSPAKVEVSENLLTTNSGSNADKKLEKAKQNWTNVKKMKKEFSKLNKINKSKLNVSIEMCKKTQSAITSSKPNSATLPAAKVVEETVIEDNTPDIAGIASSNNKQVKNAIGQEAVHCSESIFREPESHNNNEKDADINMSTNNNDEDMELDDSITNKIMNKKSSKKVYSKLNSLSNDEDLQSVHNQNPEIRNVQVSIDPQTKETPTIRVPFFKKSTLQGNNIVGEQKCSENEQPTPVSSSNPDDIFITIRIGNVITNITINKKQNDVQLKVNTDREVQTSLSPKKLQEPTKIPAEHVKATEARSLQTEEKITATKEKYKKISQKPSRNLNKSASSKKNTASADTGSAQYVITESVEKELSNIMECKETNKPKSSTQKTNNSAMKSLSKLAEINDEICAIHVGEMELEEDIFNSGSVKELKSAKPHAPSEILIPTRTQRTNRNKTQKSDKRERDTDDIIEDTSHKRRKVTPQEKNVAEHSFVAEKDPNKPATLEQDTLNKCRKVTRQDKKVAEHSFEGENDLNKPATLEQDSLNYDDVINQEFANIDADMKYKASVEKAAESQLRVTQPEMRSQVITQKKHKLGGEKTQTIVEANLQKDSENMFSTVGNALEKGNTVPAGPSTQQYIDDLLTPRTRDQLAGGAGGHAEGGGGEAVEEVVCTPAMDVDDLEDVVEETPRKETSENRGSSFTKKLQLTKPKIDEQKTSVAIAKGKTLDSQDIGSIINLTDTVRESTCPQEGRETMNAPLTHKQTLETPLTINKFFNQIQHNSTPMARKSLNFTKTDDQDLTLCPDTSLVAKTTQEKELMAEAFESRTTPIRKPLLAKNVMPKLCIAGSCLSQVHTTNLKILCIKRQWSFVDKYVPELTHLVVAVDEDGRAQRSVKYMCALAAGKWIVSHKWIEKCLETNSVVKEDEYEALDSTGDPGPQRSRLATTHKVFRGFTFYCMPPFSVLDADTLTSMLIAAGGQVVKEPSQVRVNSRAPTILLAEPEHTQEDRFVYLAMELSIVPVNYEWALNCLGSYCLHSLYDLLLCPPSLLPRTTSGWPQVLLASPEHSMSSK